MPNKILLLHGLWIKGKSISATDKKCFINSCKNLGHLTQNVIFEYIFEQNLF